MTETDQSQQFENVKKHIMYSAYCTGCWPTKRVAVIIYQGNSFCERCCQEYSQRITEAKKQVDARLKAE